MPYIMNVLRHPLPNPFSMTEEEEDRYADMRRRAHLKYSVPEKGIKALTREERVEMDAIRKKMRFSTAPMWNGHEFHFAAFGEQGCLLEVEENVAHFLSTKWHGAIVNVTDAAAVPKGVTPMRRSFSATGMAVPKLSLSDVLAEAKESGSVRTKSGDAPGKAIIGPQGVVPA